MALLQIAEPGQSSAPHEHKLAAGIDLGTTNSLVAAVRSGDASTLKDELGGVFFPPSLTTLKQIKLSLVIRRNKRLNMIR